MTVTIDETGEWVSQQVAAARLRRSQARISQLISSGQLTARRVGRGGRGVLIERASLNRLLARRLREAEALIAAARGEGL